MFLYKNKQHPAHIKNRTPNYTESGRDTALYLQLLRGAGFPLPLLFYLNKTEAIVQTAS